MNITEVLADMQNLLENHKLSAYEEKAVSSMLEFGRTKLRLTVKQVLFFENIASNYSEEAVSQREQWYSTYDEKRLKI